MKKCLCLIILSLLALTPLSISAEIKTADPFGATDTEGLHVDFLWLEDTCTDVIIPEAYEGDKVVSLLAGALDSFPQVERIYIPISVTHIDDGVFDAHKNTTFIVHKDSYAHQYAMTNGLSYAIWGNADAAEHINEYLGEWQMVSYDPIAALDNETEASLKELCGQTVTLAITSYGQIENCNIPDSDSDWWWTEDCLGVIDEGLDELCIVTLHNDQLVITYSNFVLKFIRPVSMVAISVSYRPITDNEFSYTEEVYGEPGTQLVIEANPSCIPNGYELYGSDRVVVKIDKEGVPSKEHITFYSQPIPCPHLNCTEEIVSTENIAIENDSTEHLVETVWKTSCLKCGETLNIDTRKQRETHVFSGSTCWKCGYTKPTAKQIVPYNYKTQYSRGSKSYFGNFTNQNPSMNNMLDDNSQTQFMWVSHQSEYQDNVPDFTFYFDGNEITSMRIRNGDIRSESSYYNHGRLVELRLVIYYEGKSAIEYVEIPDRYSAGYYEHEMSRKYTNVSQIEITYNQDGRVQGKKQGEVNYFYITDIMFMGY